MLGPKSCLEGYVATIAEASLSPPRRPGPLSAGPLQALSASQGRGAHRCPSPWSARIPPTLTLAGTFIQRSP